MAFFICMSISMTYIDILATDHIVNSAEPKGGEKMADKMKATLNLAGKESRGEHSMPQSADLRNAMGKQLNEAYTKEAQGIETKTEGVDSKEKTPGVESSQDTQPSYRGIDGKEKTVTEVEAAAGIGEPKPLEMFEKDGIFWHETTWKEIFDFLPQGAKLDESPYEEEDEGQELKPIWSVRMNHTPLDWLTFRIDRIWPVYADETLANPLDMPRLSLGFLNELHKIFPVKLSGGEVDLLAGTFWTEGAETFLEVATHADDEDVCHVVLLDYWSRLSDWTQVSQQRAKAAYQSGAIFFRSMPEKTVGGTDLSGVDIYVFPADFCQELQKLLFDLAKSRRKVFQGSRKILQMEKNLGFGSKAGTSADSAAEKGATPPVKN